MTNYTRVAKVVAAILGAGVLACCTIAVLAQSGRQIRKTAPLPVPTPEASPTPKPAEKPKPAYTFLVGMDRFADFTRISLHAYSGVLRNCADRLDDSFAVKVEMTKGDISRGDAVLKAKQEKEAHVVWLELRPQIMTGPSGINDDPYNVYIHYAVFAPVTGKQVTSGNTYPDAYRNQRIRVPSPTINEDYHLNQAARGAAEKILDHFHIRLIR